jgi:hypothetical protein
MIKEYPFNASSKEDLKNDIAAIISPIILIVLVVISYRGLYRNYSAPFYMFSLLFIFVIYYDIRWFKVLKKRHIKSIKCNLKTLDINLTTVGDVTVDSNLKDIKYKTNRFGDLSELKIKGKKYPGVYNLTDWEELASIIFKHCKSTF